LFSCLPNVASSRGLSSAARIPQVVVSPEIGRQPILKIATSSGMPGARRMPACKASKGGVVSGMAG
jgi:hypothetical protein